MNIRRNSFDISKRAGTARRSRIPRADLHTGILGLLAERPQSGYQIMQELDRRSGSVWQPSPGSVYPALQQLVDEGLIHRDEVAGVRSFRLTDRGLARVSAQRGQLEALWAAVSAMASAEVIENGHLLRELEIAARQVQDGGSKAQVRAASEVLRRARRALYGILAGDEDTA
jgi:DNA-binding PadR family transcriptional regulator